MKLTDVALMLLLLLFITSGTVHISQLASADGLTKPIEIGLYWDKECTNPVSSIDFGIMKRGQSKHVTFWLRNHGTDKGRISWDSANFHPSSNWITETWERKVGKFIYNANWHKKMKGGDLWEILYTIQVSQDTQVGSYGWDLIVSFTISHKISCVFVSCILTATQ